LKNRRKNLLAFFAKKPYNLYMRISSRGRYSLEALLYLALLPQGSFASTRSIAQDTGIPERYLEQLFIPLRTAKIISGIRGAKGGYFLNRPPEKVTVGDIFRAVEGSLVLAECVESCPLEDQCMSRFTWAELYETIKDCVDSVTLEDLCAAYNTLDPEYAI
jgi:Rrf2 family protein